MWLRKGKKKEEKASMATIEHFNNETFNEKMTSEIFVLPQL